MQWNSAIVDDDETKRQIRSVFITCDRCGGYHQVTYSIPDPRAYPDFFLEVTCLYCGASYHVFQTASEIEVSVASAGRGSR